MKHDIEYARIENTSLRLDLHFPADLQAEQRLPAILCVHGGGWKSGSKSYIPPLPLVTRGYVLASIDYRLSPKATFPAQIHDCKGALRFLRAHAGEFHIDPRRIGAWGNSAGGHLVALLATTSGNRELEGDVGGNLDQSSEVQAVCSWHGPADLLSSTREVQQSVGMNHEPGQPLAQLLGGVPEAKPELARLASPIYHVNKGASPFLLMHGDLDDAVPLEQSRRMADALRQAEVEVTLIVVENVGHQGELFDLTPVGEFFDRWLKQPPK